MTNREGKMFRIRSIYGNPIARRESKILISKLKLSLLMKYMQKIRHKGCKASNCSIKAEVDIIFQTHRKTG